MLATIKGIEFSRDRNRFLEADHDIEIEADHITAIKPVESDVRSAGLAPITARSVIVLTNPASGDEQFVFLRTDLEKLFNEDRSTARTSETIGLILAHAEKVDFIPLHPRELGQLRLIIDNKPPGNDGLR